MVELAPSLLSSNFSNIQADLDKLKDANIKYLHLDIMDGVFVPNISFGFGLIKSIRKNNDFIFDTHLMIDEPIRYLEEFKDSGSDIITVHYEACSDLNKTLEKIRKLGLKVGLTFKPKTKVECILPYLKKVDVCLVMSVEPGFGGQSFMEDSLDKVRNIKKYIDENELNCLIEIDGGIKTHNLKRVIDSGVDLVVSGSDIFSNGEIKDQVFKYYKIFNS
ncbi:ribulose-phosphate 3-epimerase [Anaerococcus porci]|uniref:ribulose-phosphate 3-epimerase n=1 Tax=Anaerococcus porci TaxID=2652269 RepID=UPI002A761812|nr:ribulose-phosphate 3-epimerase [Anaerococcus porci]MDY3006178.1 ribulose-phosphate 3-epimerase [Anaerococcus porci]